MAILYPPILEGKLPAQYGTILKIPFQLNRAVSEKDIQYMIANIKSIATNSIIDTINGLQPTKTKEGYIATFTISTDTLRVGQYYKVQLAFGNSDGIAGAFSTLGIFKYTIQPTVIIKELEGNSINYAQNVYTGEYKSIIIQEEKEYKDPQEKVYEYQFDLLQNGVIIESTGRQLHDARTDTDTNMSIDTYKMRRRLDPQVYYQLRYTVYTVNGLEVSSQDYFLIQGKEFDANKNIEISVQSQPDQGAIDVNFSIVLEHNGNDNIEDIYGKYKVYRSSSLDDYSYWDELGEITLDYQYTFNDQDKNQPETPAEEKKKVKLKIKAFSDKTIEHGIKYQYALQQFDEDLNIYTGKDVSEIVSCDYVDAFLSDGERTLKIKFNPKISNFKTTKLESKLETIGGEFPFIFRNGHTNYKEFSISGLISYLMDDYYLFDIENKQNELLRDETFSSIEIDDSLETQMRHEREFKLKVLDWLNNGKPKLFRSPTEGNYIVRLLNVSLTPNEQLGRMLHTFQATAYEIAAYNYENLVANGFIGINVYKVESMFEMEIHTDNYLKPTRLYLKNIRSIDIKSTKGAKFTFTYANSKEGEGLDITIGYSGRYRIETPESNPITSILFDPAWYSEIKIKYSGHTSYPIIHKELKDEEGESFEGERKIIKIGSNQKFNQIFGGRTEKDNQYTTKNILSLLKYINSNIFKTSLNNAIDCQIENIANLKIYTKPVILVNESGLNNKKYNLDDKYIYAKQIVEESSGDESNQIIQYFSDYECTNLLNSEDFHYEISCPENDNQLLFNYNNYDYELNSSNELLDMILFNKVLDKTFVDDKDSVGNDLGKISIGRGLIAEIFYDVFFIEHAEVRLNEVSEE